MWKAKERPSGVEEWDGYDYSSLDGYGSEEEYYADIEESVKRNRAFEEFRKAHNIPG